MLLSLILSAQQQTKPSLSNHQGPALGSTQTQGSVYIHRGHATANTHRSQWVCYGGITPQREAMWSQAIRDGSEGGPQNSLGAEMSPDERLNSEFRHGNRAGRGRQEEKPAGKSTAAEAEKQAQVAFKKYSCRDSLVEHEAEGEWASEQGWLRESELGLGTGLATGERTAAAEVRHELQ